MKRFLSLTLALLCIFLAAPAALAAGGEAYELPELNMTIEVPKGWYTFDQDVQADDPVLKFLGINGKGLAEHFKENGIYLDMECADPAARIYVTMDDSDISKRIYDFNLITDEELKDGMEQASQSAEEQGKKEKIDYSEGFIYRHKQAKFYVRSFSRPVSSKLTEYGTEYITIINGQDIAFQLLYPSEGERFESLEQSLKSVVESIVFTEVTSKPIPVAPPPSAYEMPEIHMMVYSPEGWFVFTKDVKADDPDLKLLGIDGKHLTDYFKENAISLHLIDPVSEDEIVVSMADYSEGVDFNEIPDDLLLQSASKGIEEGTVSACAAYGHIQTKFIILYRDDRTEFLTSINGQIIYITLFPYRDEAKASSVQTLKRVVDSVVFTKVSSVPVTRAGPKSATIDLPELNMSIDSPEGWYTFTQDLKEDDMNLRLLGIEGKGLAEKYKEDGVFLDMISTDIYARILVKLTGNSRGINDFSDMDDDRLLFWASIINEKVKTEDVTFSDCSVYTHNQAKFAVCDFIWETEGVTLNGKRYFTVANGQWIEVSLLYDREGEIPGSCEEALKSAADSVVFTKVSSKPVSSAPVPDTASYDLPELDMTISSPKGWYVFTQEVKDGAAELELAGIDGKGIAERFKENGIFLQMEDAISDAGIIVTMTGSKNSRGIYDFSSLTDEEIVAEAEAIMKEGEDQAGEQAVFSRCNVYTHNQAKFAECAFTRQNNGMAEYGVKYITIKNGRTIDITLRSSESSISKSLAQTMKGTIDSITFKEVPPVDDFIAVYGSLAGAAAGALLGASIISIRKRRKKVISASYYRPGSINV